MLSRKLLLLFSYCCLIGYRGNEKFSYLPKIWDPLFFYTPDIPLGPFYFILKVLLAYTFIYLLTSNFREPWNTRSSGIIFPILLLWICVIIEIPGWHGLFHRARTYAILSTTLFHFICLCILFSIKSQILFTVAQFNKQSTRRYYSYKLKTFSCIVISSALIDGIYGLSLDQFTYTISHEFYTDLLLPQFGLDDQGILALFKHPRILVAIVGFKSSWWVGVPAGVIIALKILASNRFKERIRILPKVFLIILTICVLFTVVSLWANTSSTYNYQYSSRSYFFNFVNQIHFYSYTGALVGLISGILYLNYKKA